MLTSDERYAQQAESMRQALANAWAEGYLQGTKDIRDSEFTPNPYVKEN